MKRGMMYKEIYDGKFYDTFDGGLEVIKNCPEEDLLPVEVPMNDLIKGDLYVIDNGSTVRYMGGTSYEVVKRSPLYATGKIANLTISDLKTFWILVEKCKNGTGEELCEEYK